SMDNNRQNISPRSLVQPTIGSWNPAPPATKESVELAEQCLKLTFPDVYKDFLCYSNGGEGDLPIQLGLVRFWSADELADANADYEVEQWIPGFIGIGSNGGGEMIAFDTRQECWGVYLVPFVPMDEAEALPLAPDFESFLGMIGKG